MPMIQSVERALLILDLFDEYDTELKITEISDRMVLHKSTVHSLLKTLQVHRYIEQNPENGKYRLGMKLLERGTIVMHNLDIRNVVRKHLIQLSSSSGQTTNLVILDGKEGVYIDKVEGPKAIIRYSRIGKRIPIHCSAVGKVLVAYKIPKELKKLLEGYVYRSHTPKTIMSESYFMQELEKVREQGYSVDNEENEPGVRCIAVPVRDHTGQVIAAISMSTLIARVNDAELIEHVKFLQQAAEEISDQMGFGIPSFHHAREVL
ncbi:MULTISPECIES: IclR family transcriptional regulator [unclassified Paenibacillus]|uniref:IclR family transcriptional regulator n=1 Tax=unclassified Paenibacillus TaxID=185978 RepID=UPI001AE303C7|nr:MULTISPECIES: IclR family transcriptional regulator [unclassified Paenibacillus]MBP1153341.1 DNA-binding IclR family transcriptional regulator [Paenibacillus sp. PvP091]MBP1171276.1 DNA-binding IclR family transcriptional regulator [Paenibacillus sp. PvR098]MBP2442304.1 DNA-binding IclR family transcriptional regulator [Paenibacillus sp. PvP052]